MFFLLKGIIHFKFDPAFAVRRAFKGREWQIIEISNPLVILGAIEMFDPFRVISFLSHKSS